MCQLELLLLRAGFVRMLIGRGAGAVKRAALEKHAGQTPRGFKSHPLRQFTISAFLEFPVSPLRGLLHIPLASAEPIPHRTCSGAGLR